MAAVIVDASVFLAHPLSEALGPHAVVLFGDIATRNLELNAPALLRYEQLSVIRRAAYHGRISEEHEVNTRKWLLTFSIQFHFDDELTDRAYELAKQLNLVVAYDSQYLALAERLDCDFWTADRRLVEAARTTNLRVRWIGDFSSPQ